MKVIEDKLDSIKDQLHSIDKTLVRQESQLADHIRRTELLEKEVLPIKRHVDQMRGAGKFLLYSSLIASIAAAIAAFMTR